MKSFYHAHLKIKFSSRPGQRFTIAEHETVTLNKRDIRKLEMVAQLKFGRYSK
jgi:hypothetical protein